MFDYESRFRESVIERFADEYARGRTPIPCITLQPGGEVHRPARASRAISAPIASPPAIMSGASSAPTGAELHRAADPARDQSYFLFATTARPARLSCAFRSATCPRPRCARSPRELALAVADKPDSQDICFVPDGDYAAGGARSCGPRRRARARSSTATGGCSARIAGLIHFTVGQRRGLEIGGQPEPLYVLRLEPESAAGGGRPEARARGARARGSTSINWLGEGQREGLTAKVRSLARPVPARFDGEAVHFERPEYGVAPGQAAVLYDGDRVLGGGWIEETVAAELEPA